MEITEIRIKLMEGSEDRLRAFCSITIDQSFVVRDLKIIDGSHGPFVAMPSRKLTGHCNRCGSKNHLRAGFCNQCGAKLQGNYVTDSPQKLYADVAHPINSECREMIQNAVIEEFNAELQRSSQPDYRSRYDDDFDAGDYDEADYAETPISSASDDDEPAPIASPVARRENVAAAHPLQLPKPTVAVKATDMQPAEDDNDSFAAGLFEADPVPSSEVAPESPDAEVTRRLDQAQAELDAPHFATGTTADEESEPTATEEEAVFVRSESGVSNTIPRPHFRDQPGGSSRQSVTTSPSSEGGRGIDRTDAREDDHDPVNPGFGAGILDD